MLGFDETSPERFRYRVREWAESTEEEESRELEHLYHIPYTIYQHKSIFPHPLSTTNNNNKPFTNLPPSHPVIPQCPVHKPAEKQSSAPEPVGNALAANPLAAKPPRAAAAAAE